MNPDSSFYIDKKYALILLVPSVFVAAVFINVNPLSPDGVQYSDLGRSLFEKGVYASPYGVVPGWVQPPMLPVLIGIFSLLFSVEAAGQLVGLSCAALTGIILYNFVKQEFNRDIALLSVLILSINPMFLLINTGVLTEPLYTLIHLGLFVLLYKNVKLNSFSNNSVLWTGLLFAALFLTRSEAILYLPLLVFVFFRFANWKKGLTLLAIALIVFTINGFYSLNKMDSFKISPKLNFSSRMGSFVANYFAEQQNQPGIKDKNTFSWYGYDASSKALYSENIMDNDYFATLQRKYPDNMSLKEKSYALINRVGYNLYALLKALVISPYMPVSFAFLVLTGLIFFYRQDKKFLLSIIFWLIPAFYFLVSHVEIRFLYITLPYFSLIAAYGLFKVIRSRRYARALLLTVFTLMIFNNYIHYSELYENRDQNVKYHVIADHFKQTGLDVTKICSKNFYVAFWGGYDYIKLPICNPDQLFVYMKKNKSDILLLDAEVFSSHAGLMDIYENRSDRFRFMEAFDFGKQTLKMYRIQTNDENSKSEE